MKIMAVNSSPRAGGQSKTGLMLNHLVQGMRAAGGEAEVFHLREKKVKNCLGCFTCWTKTPGRCVIKDDMTSELFPKFLESDLLVLATPLYHYGLNAAIKAFVERTLPALEPFFAKRAGRTVHPLRSKHPAVAVLSVAGFPEIPVFDQLSSHVNYLYQEGLVAEIYRPAAESMVTSMYRDAAEDIFKATEQAGRELVESMKVSPETMARITQPLGDSQSIAEIANLFWKTCIAEGVTPKEFDQKGMIPRPDSLETFMTIMSMGFNPQAAAGTRASVQFSFSGEVQGSCCFIIQDGSIEAASGDAEKPDLTIQTPFEVWMDIMTGKAGGQQMFMEQKYRAEGDLSLLLRMNELFGQSPDH